jgi:hypothetical protein
VTTPSPATPLDRAQLAADVEALQADLGTLPRREALDKAIYQCGRLATAIRSSHNEATRFAAFTVAKIVRDLASDLPPAVVSRMQAIKTALEATGLDLSK